MEYPFFATVSRMKYINRWALMRCGREENLSEHSLETAMIAHCLCLLGNIRYGHSMNAERAAVLGLYHDASEIMTGDMPTPVKYCNDEIRNAYKAVERAADRKLLERLPEDMQPYYREILCGPQMNAADAERNKDTVKGQSGPQENSTLAQSDPEEIYMRRLVKAADKLSALIKCIEEESGGNTEFRSARLSTKKTVDRMCREMPEVNDFVRDFLPAYGKTLDELEAQSGGAKADLTD